MNVDTKLQKNRQLTITFTIDNQCFGCKKEFSETLTPYDLQKLCLNHSKINFDKDHSNKKSISNILSTWIDEPEVFQQYCLACFEKLLLKHLQRSLAFIPKTCEDNIEFTISCPICCSKDNDIDIEEFVKTVSQDSGKAVLKAIAEKKISYKTQKYYCPTTNCGYCVETNDDLKFVVCPKHGSQCIDCWQNTTDDQHECKLFPQEFESVKGEYDDDVRRCPKCRVGVQRSGGCYRMTCNNCCHSFSWLEAIELGRDTNKQDVAPLWSSWWSRTAPICEKFSHLNVTVQGPTEIYANEEDINLVQSQVQCTYEAAATALKKNSGDIVNAIMDLTNETH